MMLLIAAATGAALATVKGTGLDAAYVLGNSSAAYVLLPLLAGRQLPRRSIAVVLGVATTQLALATFYLTASTLYLGTLSLDFSLGRWFLAGAASGSLLSLLGHRARQHTRLLLLIPALLLLEPVATALATAVGFGSRVPPSALLLASAVEAGLGLVVLVLMLVRRRGGPARDGQAVFNETGRAEGGLPSLRDGFDGPGPAEPPGSAP